MIFSVLLAHLRRHRAPARDRSLVTATFEHEQEHEHDDD
jgi:hypothetical protein